MALLMNLSWILLVIVALQTVLQNTALIVAEAPELATALAAARAAFEELFNNTLNDSNDIYREADDDYVIDFSSYGEAIFGYPDNDTTGVLVAAYTREFTSQNPEELGMYLEGDILIPANHKWSHRNGILTQSYRWPRAVVPYEIKGTFSTRELAIIQHAFNEYHTKTCVRFRPRTTERDYISIVNGKTGCWSSVGRLGGRQEVNLQSPSCVMYYGTTIHELMHALGFFHEQNRHERDAFVKVMSENVKPGMILNFEKYSAKTSYAFGVAYDYSSVMHYSPTSFSKNGKPTLKALKKTKESQLMGQRNGFSSGDVQKINAMYHCK